MTTRGLLEAALLCCCLLLTARAQQEVREPPEIVEPPSSRSEFRLPGKDVTIQCYATGQPAPRYEWLFNGAAISSEEDHISYNASSGLLTITGLTIREEGFFSCKAKNTFSNGQSAVAMSPKIEVRQARVEDWVKADDKTKTATQGNYVFIKCGDPLPVYYGTTTFKWYSIIGTDDLEEIDENARVFIDDTGTLHFTYVLTEDQSATRYYACAMSNVILGKITLGGRTRLEVSNTIEGNIPEVKPVLQYRTGKDDSAALTFQRGKEGRLECVFSGYVNVPGQEVPVITWTDNAGNTIVSGEERYTISADGRVLNIANLEEADEKPYTCTATNSQGNAAAQMILNVTSTPIWVHPLLPVTAVQGSDAALSCVARSANEEQAPNSPRWFRNGMRLDLNYDPNKYEFSADKTSLTVKSVQKNSDIACYQCYVDNSVGESFSDACLNVILPIVFVTKPAAEQTIEKGDTVNLTVVAESDPLYPVAYKWTFKDVEYEAGFAPPHVTFDANSKLAYINTSALSQQQMQEVAGLYRREVFNPFQIEVVDVDVALKSEPGVAAAGFDWWIIGLALGVLLLIIVLIIICCVICRRKMQEGEYSVDRKEHAAGLDPKKELMNSEFPELSRADGYNHPDKKSPTLDFDDIPIAEGDDESFGSAEYGEEPTAFNENGSFIGVYTDDKRPPGLPAYSQSASQSHV